MAKSRKSKPSFDAPDAQTPAMSWVSRSDAGPSEPALAAATASRETEPAGEGADAAPKASVGVTGDAGEPAVGPSAGAALVRTMPLAPDRRARAQQIVERHATYAAATGLVPLPVLDMVALTSLQLSMLRAVAAVYGVPFSDTRGRAVLAAVVGSAMPTLAGHQVLRHVVQRLNPIGALFGMATLSGFAVATTSAMGRVFITHVEAGGTLDDLDTDQVCITKAADLSSTRAGAPGAR